jgi:hypothetical protein
MSEIKLIQYFDAHWYKIERENGLKTSIEFYPSVTTKLSATSKEFLERWRGDIGNREADLRLFDAQMRGRRIHKAWEILSQGGAVIYQPWDYPVYTPNEIVQLTTTYPLHMIIQYQDEMLDVLKLQKFTEIVKPNFVAAELKIFSDQYKEAGTVDNILEIKEGYYPVSGKTAIFLQGGLWVADLKTGNSYSDQAALQQAAYAHMYEALSGQTVVGTLGLHTGAKTKTGIPGFSAYPRTRTEWLEDFQAYREIAAVWERKNKHKQPENLEFPSFVTLSGLSDEKLKIKEK